MLLLGCLGCLFAASVVTPLIGILLTLIALLLLVGLVVPSALEQRLEYHSIRGQNVGSKERELMGLVMVVGVDWRLHRILDQFLECSTLADEFNEFGDTAPATEHDKLFLFEKELFDRATFLLVQQLVDLDVASVCMHIKQQIR